jgi:hypothetical protein
VNNPCPSGYRIPTEAEINAECLSWSARNPAGAYASPLKLPVAQRRRSDGTLDNGDSDGFQGFYWSSTVSGGNESNCIEIDQDDTVIDNRERINGFSVRCIKN